MAFYLNLAPFLAQLAVGVDQERAAHDAHELAAVQGFFLDDVELLAELLIRVGQ